MQKNEFEETLISLTKAAGGKGASKGREKEGKGGEEELSD